MEKVLIVTYYWPPAGGPGVQRWLKFATYLPEFGFHPVVYIPKNAFYPIRDESLLTQIPKNISLIAQPIREPYGLAARIFGRKARRLSSGIISSKKPSLTERFMLWVRGNFYIPDGRKHWVKPSVQYLSRIMRDEGIKTVITSGPPHSLHLIGLGLQDQVGVRWIADFRDPWTTIGYHKDLRLLPWAQKKHERLEKYVLQRADLVLVTSRHTRDEFAQKTGQPIRVITNGHDLETVQEVKLDQAFTISHIGSLLSGRNPGGLWTVLAECVREIPGFAEDLEIHLVGVVGEEVLSSAKAAGLASHLKHLPYVSHAKAIALQRQSQLLMLAEIDSPETRAIIPGKLFEYMASRRPILAIGPDDWEVAGMIREHNLGQVFSHNDREGMRKAVQRWYEQYKAGTLLPTDADVLRFSRRSLTGVLAQLLRSQ